MRNSALELSLTRAAAVTKFGNVVVLHGILGGELSESGTSINPVLAAGTLKKYYGDLL